MAGAVLWALPLRRDRTRLLAGLVTLPGLVMAASHAPLALATFGPLIALCFVVTQRERYRLDRALIALPDPDAPGPAGLRLLYQGRRERLLLALDLRYALRRSDGGAEVLYEPGGGALLCGEDPAPELSYARAPETTAELPAELLLLRLAPPDLATLRAVLARIPPRPPPREDLPAELLPALGSPGAQGPRAEAALRRLLAVEDTRPSGLRATLQELALRPDEVGAAARRVLSSA